VSNHSSQRDHADERHRLAPAVLASLVFAFRVLASACGKRTPHRIRDMAANAGGGSAPAFGPQVAETELAARTRRIERAKRASFAENKDPQSPSFRAN